MIDTCNSESCESCNDEDKKKEERLPVSHMVGIGCYHNTVLGIVCQLQRGTEKSLKYALARYKLENW